MRRPVVGRKQQSRSRAPLFAALAGVAIAAVAVGYYVVGRSPEPASSPAPPATQPTPAPTPALSAPVTVAAAPSPDATPAGTPGTAPTPTPAPAPVSPETATTPTPAPPPTTTPPPPTAPTGDPLALLRQGAFHESAQASATTLGAEAQGRYSIQALAACSPDTIRKAAQNVSGDEIFILPVALNGRACFRVCWGVFDSREGAAAGMRALPDYFRQSGVKPRIQSLAELLP